MLAIMASDSAVQSYELYWVGAFEEGLLELGNRAAHWEVEENDGAGDLLRGLVGVDDNGWPTLTKGREYVVVSPFAICKCCGGSGMTPDGRLILNPQGSRC